MKLQEYLKQKKLKPIPWAVKHGVAPAVMSRLMSGSFISIQNALKIEKATRGKVRVQDLFDKAA